MEAPQLARSRVFRLPAEVNAWRRYTIDRLS
jgi:hypothetical protein